MKKTSKLIHYSREGYQGNYIDYSVCGKKVNTHLGNESCSIHPKDANCKDCFATKEYQTDLSDFNISKLGFKRRILY